MLGGIAWMPGVPLFFIFAMFVPLLKIEKDLSENKKSWILVGILSFFVFFLIALASVWWILYASFAGVLVMVLYAIGFTVPFVLFHITRKKLGNVLGYFSLIVYWLVWEFANYHVEIPLPWLNLGNIFSKTPQIVQWYEYTGVLGGTVWILLLNILLYILLDGKSRRKKIIAGFSFLFVLILPMVISLQMYRGYIEKENSVYCVIVQPNIDSYKEKYTGALSPEEQLKKALDLAEKKMDTTVRYVILPETAITGDNWLHEMKINPRMLMLNRFLEKYPWVHLIVGADLYAAYPADGFVPPTATRLNDHYFFDAYNAALQVDTTGEVAYYFKSKLLVGVEMLPYPDYLSFVRRISEKFGGAAFTLATQKESSVFYSTDEDVVAAPIICYESVFGDYVASYVRKGANMLVIITNDGWWGNTPGYIHHLQYATLRAVETRRPVVRSANTGVSAVIDQRGDIINPTEAWEKAVVKATVNINNDKTFYTVHGDYLGRLSIMSGLLLLVLVLFFHYKKSNIRRF